MTKNEYFLLHQFSLMELSVQPMEMTVRILEAGEQPEVEIVAEIGVHRDHP